MKKYAVVCTMAILIYGFFLWGIIAPDAESSVSERRKLAAAPKFTLKSASSGEYMTKFEDYTLDQFPLRDSFRTLKAISAFYVFGQKDNNKLYICDGYASKLEYPLSESSIDYAAGCFDNVYKNFLKDKDVNIYAVIVPDKNYYIAEQNGYPSMDYGRMYELLPQKLSYMEFIDVRDLLSIEDYYKTDTHWRQECIVDVADKILKAMGAADNTPMTSDTMKGIYEKKSVDKPFYGVYYGQASLPLPPETLYYLDNATIQASTVQDFETGKTLAVYDMAKTEGADLYEMFLSGSKSLLVIDNPQADTDKELVIFRDSFGSSIAPLFIKDYAKVTLIDIRYISPVVLKNYIEFDNQDVLFLYSTLVLNNSSTIKK